MNAKTLYITPSVHHDDIDDELAAIDLRRARQCNIALARAAVNMGFALIFLVFHLPAWFAAIPFLVMFYFAAAKWWGLQRAFDRRYEDLQRRDARAGMGAGGTR